MCVLIATLMRFPMSDSMALRLMSLRHSSEQRARAPQRHLPCALFILLFTLEPCSALAQPVALVLLWAIFYFTPTFCCCFLCVFLFAACKHNKYLHKYASACVCWCAFAFKCLRICLFLQHLWRILLHLCRLCVCI